MAIGSIGNYLSPTQGYFSSNGTLLQYMTSLSEQKKAVSQNSSYFNESLFSKMGTINSASARLQTQISGMASLSQYSSSIGKAASYSDKDVLSANVAKNATVSSYTKTDVNVTQLAAAQQNKGDALKADENAFGSQFSISIKDNSGKSNQFSVDLAAGADNKSAMQSMADKINASNTGFKASLVEDKDNNTVSLQISGTKTGDTDGKFTVDDTSAANLGNVDQQSKNAQYTVNGASFSSQTNNNVKLTDGVTADLKKTGATQVTYKADAGAAVSSVQNFIDTFNSMKDAASGSQTLNKQLADVAGNFSGALGYAGIGTDSKGNLTIKDESKLSQSISDGSFAKNFQGVGSFGNKLSEISRNAYKTAYNSAVQDNFKTLLDNMSKTNNQANSWLNGLSSSAGLLFNMLV